MNVKLFIICGIAVQSFLFILAIIIVFNREQRLYQLLTPGDIYRIATDVAGTPVYIHIISKQNSQITFTIKCKDKEGRPQTISINDFYRKWGYIILEDVNERNRIESK